MRMASNRNEHFYASAPPAAKAFVIFGLWYLLPAIAFCPQLLPSPTYTGEPRWPPFRLDKCFSFRLLRLLRAILGREPPGAGSQRLPDVRAGPSFRVRLRSSLLRLRGRGRRGRLALGQGRLPLRRLPALASGQEGLPGGRARGQRGQGQDQRQVRQSAVM